MPSLLLSPKAQSFVHKLVKTNHLCLLWWHRFFSSVAYRSIWPGLEVKRQTTSLGVTDWARNFHHLTQTVNKDSPTLRKALRTMYPTQVFFRFLFLFLVVCHWNWMLLTMNSVRLTFMAVTRLSYTLVFTTLWCIDIKLDWRSTARKRQKNW